MNNPTLRENKEYIDNMLKDINEHDTNKGSLNNFYKLFKVMAEIIKEESERIEKNNEILKKKKTVYYLKDPCQYCNKKIAHNYGIKRHLKHCKLYKKTLINN